MKNGIVIASLFVAIASLTFAGYSFYLLQKRPVVMGDDLTDTFCVDAKKMDPLKFGIQVLKETESNYTRVIKEVETLREKDSLNQITIKDLNIQVNQTNKCLGVAKKFLRTSNYLRSYERESECD